MVTPAGNPLWTRTSDHATYGGDTDKRNYQSQGVVNPKTDVGADAFVRMAADIAAMGRTAPFCVITFAMDDGTPDDPTVTYVRMMTGIQDQSYAGDAPPTGFPTVTRLGNGSARIAFDATYTDDYGSSGSYTPRQALGSATEAARIVTCTVSGSNVDVEVQFAGGADTSPTVVIQVF